MQADRETVHVLGAGTNQRVLVPGPAGADMLVTCLFLSPVELALDPLVRELVCGGAAPDVPPEVATLFEGFRVRATLGAIAGLPDVVGAEVGRAAPPGAPLLAAAYGYARVTLRCAVGTPLSAARPGLATADKLALLDDLLRLLDELAGRGVAHHALEPAGIVAAAGGAWLLDLAPLRRVEAGAVPSVRAVAPVAAWLLEDELAQPEPPPEVEPWRNALAPASSDAADAAVADADAADGHGTQFVPDGTLFGYRPTRAEPPAAVADDTVFVPDEPAPRPGPERPRGALVALALVLALALLGAIWHSRCTPPRHPDGSGPVGVGGPTIRLRLAHV